VSRVGLRGGKIKPGQIVALRSPEDNTELLVKRVLATEFDTVM